MSTEKITAPVPGEETLALLGRWGEAEPQAAEADFAAVFSGFNRKIVVLDDDPTGVQTVHDVAVYTDWSVETFRAGLLGEEKLFFVLTNSRSFSAEETRAVHRKIADHLAQASRETGRPFVLISRSDSTLRGHYPLETQTLRQELEARLPVRFDGEILLPFFLEGGRYTVGDVHYVREGDRLIPAGETEFARDTTFGYTASDLKAWCEEKTGGACRAEDVTSISLEELRHRDYDAIREKLLAVHDFGKVVVNAAAYADVQVFATAFLQALAAGKEFLFRGSAAIVKVLGHISDQPLLKRADLIGEETAAGGIVIVGSHVKKTTLQLEELQRRVPDLTYLCFDAAAALVSGGLEEEHRRVLALAAEAMAQGKTAVVYTSRTVLRTAEDSREGNLALSVRISQALTSLVAELPLRPAFVLAKGGITSSDVGVKALAVRRAMVRGQIAPGIPVWETGGESRFPHIPYVIFPGNVGDTGTLAQVVETLLGRK